MNIAEDFRQVIAGRLQCEPPARIEPGRFTRFSTNGSRDDDSGWALLFDDEEGGVFGDWRTGASESWFAKSQSDMTESQRRDQQQRIERGRREAEAARVRAEAEAAERAFAIYKAAESMPPTGHPYLAAKGIAPSPGIRVYRGDLTIRGMSCDGALVIPVRVLEADGARMVSLQFISPAGEKRFLAGGRKAGGYFGIGTPGSVICICEGYATGVSIHAATDHTVAVAFDAGNLEPVARSLRARFPTTQIVLCADNDVRQDASPNVGVQKALEAARAVGGVVAIPMPIDGKPTDFNDLHAAQRLDAVRAALDSARRPDEWSIPSDGRESATPQTQVPSAAPEGDADSSETAVAADHLAIVAELAKLDQIEYDRRRKAAAQQLGVRESTLDEAVRRARPTTPDGEQGSAVKFRVVEPCVEPVDGAALLDELAATLRCYVVLPDLGAEAIALWVVLTYVLDSVRVAPILAITSPDKRCGKSTLLAVLDRLVARALAASNISAAALFRVVEKHRPTLLIDEADSFLRDNEELRGVLNSGHTRDVAFVMRCVGDDSEPRRFSTWGCKVIALIGGLPGTLTDRSIVVDMQRKSAGERVERLRHASPGVFGQLTAKLARWSRDHLDAVRRARPEIPEELHDRAQDNWEGLLAIADFAGGKWPALARRVALALATAQSETSLLVDLLTRARAAFVELGSRVSGADMVTYLLREEDSPWHEYRHGKPVTKSQLARFIRQRLGLMSVSVKLEDGTTPKGYKVENFADAFERYAPSSQSATAPPSSTGAAGGVFDSATWKAEVADSKPPPSSTGAAGGAVADREPPSRSGGDDEVDEIRL